MSAQQSGAMDRGAPLPLDGSDERSFGFWLFLLSDAIIFALLFATYVVLSGNTAGGPGGKELFDLSRVFAETMLLLASSATFGFATLAMVANDRKGVLLWLSLTFLLGLAFIGLEIGEFRGMIADGAGPDRSGFLSAFFTLVGTHGLHVSAGLICIAVMGAQVIVKGLTVPVISRLYRLGLFWHLLDIVWICIFSVVYLPGVLEPIQSDRSHSDGAILRQDQAKARGAHPGVRVRDFAPIMAQNRPSPRTGIYPGSLCKETSKSGGPDLRGVSDWRAPDVTTVLPDAKHRTAPVAATDRTRQSRNRIDSDPIERALDG